MLVPSLQTAVSSSIVHHIWYNSKLRNMTMKRAYKGYCNQTEEIASQIEELIENLCEKLVEISILSEMIKAKLTTALANIVEEINSFVDEIVENMVDVTESKLQICLKHIKLTPDGYVDKTNTILNTIKDSQFAIKFPTDFLFENAVDREALKKVSNNMCFAEINCKRKILQIKNMKSMLKCKSVTEYLEVFQEYTEDCPRKYFGLGVIEILICENRVDLLAYYYKTVEPSERDHEVEVAADFVFENMRMLDADVLMFLYENMPTTSWDKYVKKYFNRIVAGFASSWRFMHYNVQWFQIAITENDKDMFIQGLLTLSANYKLHIYDKVIKAKIFKDIWMNGPKIIKDEDEVYKTVCSTIISEMEDFDLLEFILKTYDTEKKKQSLVDALFHTLTKTGDTETIGDINKCIKNLGFCKKKFKDYMRFDVVKDKLLNIYSIEKKNMADFNKLLALFGAEEATEFKNTLLKDEEFITKALDKFWFEKNTKEFFVWLNNDSEEAFKVLLNKLINDKVIDKVYEKVIIDSGDFDHIEDKDMDNPFSVIRVMEKGHITMADEGIDFLGISQSEKKEIKLRVLSKPEVRKHILICYFRCESEYDISKEWSLFYNDIRSGKKFFKELFLSEPGMDSILDIVLYCRKMRTVYMYEEQIQYYTKLRVEFLDKFVLNATVDEVLREHGHPNAKGDPIGFEGREPKNDEEIFIGKVIVDFKYRTLRAVLNSPSPFISYNKKMVGFFGDLSHQLARRVHLNIPEVI